MKRELDLVMFDLDGTLADTGQDLANSVNYIRMALDLEPLEEALVRSHVGRGVEFLLRRTLPEKHQTELKTIMGQFLEHYKDHLLDTTALYPYVPEILDYFGVKRRAVVSNKPHWLAVAVLRGLGVESCFDAILGGDSMPDRKPDPGPLNHVLAKFRVAPLKALIVGDGAPDIQAGKRAGVVTCGVTYGLGAREEVVEAEPDLLIDDLKELTEYFY